MPSARKPFARSRTRVAASSHETGCQPVGVSIRYAGVSRRCATASPQSAAIVRRRPAPGAERSSESVSVAIAASSLVRPARQGSAAQGRNPRSHYTGRHMRTTWNGSISFGLVNIAVGLAPATKPAARQSDIAFRTLHRECGTPIKQKRWCPEHEREVAGDELVKGWEVSKGEFVVVEDADLEAIAQHDNSRAIEITRFVDEGDVDAIYFDRTYFLVPSGTAAARRPYVLLLNAMRDTGMAAVGRFVLAGKEKLCLIRPKG